eukprot:PhM_4_TR5672/c0_g1_i1/m.14864/K04421/MAP3K3, MEKK3; mitogen-activated protein kinase kinase kinase 3
MSHSAPPPSVSSRCDKSRTFRKNDKKLIGRGASGAVYLGLDEENGELVAIKEVPIQPDAPIDVVEKELSVVQCGGFHPNVVNYYDAVVRHEEGLVSIYMEYVSGGSLGSTIRKFGALPLGVVRKYAVHILKGLDYLHTTLRLCHRDIKPDNILLTSEGVCKLTDFGVSAALKDTGTAGCMTVVGTPAYMAPEMLQGERYNSAADIWSFGCVVFEMVSGTPPWSECPNPAAVMFRVVGTEGGPTLPSSVSDPGVREFMKQCFVKEAHQRPSAAELLQHPFLAGVAKQDNVQPAVIAPPIPLPCESVVDVSVSGAKTVMTGANNNKLNLEEGLTQGANNTPAASTPTVRPHRNRNLCHACVEHRALFSCDMCPSGRRQFCVSCWDRIHQDDAVLRLHKKAPLLFPSSSSMSSRPGTSGTTRPRSAAQQRCPGDDTNAAADSENEAENNKYNYSGMVLDNGRLVDVLRPELHWACPRCTFLNHPCMSQCEMCEL